MRSAEQIGRTVKQWKDHQQAERERTLRQLLAVLERARRERQPWYVWIEQGRPPLTEDEYRALHPPGARSARGGRR